MFNNTYYHGITRKMIVAFGKLFSEIKIERTNKQGVVEQVISVPVSYGNREKWNQRLQEEPNIDKRVLITLPRIGFEFLGMEYDTNRKLNKLTQLRTCGVNADGTVATAFAPVPYILKFAVYIVTKTQDDALRIIEQIIPYFSPSYTVSINLIPELNVVQDIPFTLDGLNLSDSFDGPMENRREIVYTLEFTAMTQYLGPISNSNAVILHTKVKIDPQIGDIARQVDTDVVGTLEDYVIVDDVFDIPSPIV